MEALDVLKQYYGHSDFRSGQAELIEAILQGRDAFGIMPTGGGKSICYQIPGILLKGIALVISPLISLMKDQVMALQNMGIAAAYLNSSQSREEAAETLRDLAQGRIRILYVAPERLDQPHFVELVKDLELSLVAVDEAHCISQWGQDFRPSYLRIPAFLEHLPCRPVLAAFTATATALVQEDICRILHLQDTETVITGFDRPNLRYKVLHPKNKDAALLELIRERHDKCGIIYCATRSKVETVCRKLLEAGCSATRYHAGLDEEERRRNQEDFIFDRREIMVATNAFGMGIDKSNVNYVIHYNMPKSPEAYYQEAGRAGRDGQSADCILLFSAGDVVTARYLIENSSDNEELTPEQREEVRQKDMQRLDAMIGYCRTRDCLRGCILDYFGQSHEERCGNCGNCSAEYKEIDMTREAQMILSCIKRIRDKLGYAVGATIIVRTLHGSKEQRIMDLELDGLSTYGLMHEVKRSRIREYMDALEEQGYLYTDPQFKTVCMDSSARRVLFEGEKVVLRSRVMSAVEQKGKEKNRKGQPSAEDGSLFAALRALRVRLAQEEQVPAYIIFSNATLADMALLEPQSRSEFLEVSGVGKVKADRYCEVFLEEIRRWRQEQDGQF